MKRREFLRCAGYSTGGIALGCVALGSTCDSLSTVTEPLVRTPLSLPDTVRGTGLLTASDGASVGLGDGRQGSGWGYGGALPGPTVRVRRGDHVDLRLRNNLGQETTVHWHGLVVPSAMDGHPRDAVPPGGDYRYEYVVDQRAGLNWYHPHPHHLVGEQVAKGLSGLFIIEDDEEASLELPSRPREVPLVIRDARVGLDDQLEYRRRAEGFRGDFPLVNGTAYPALDVESAVASATCAIFHK